jgi:hypothetical protein
VAVGAGGIAAAAWMGVQAWQAVDELAHIAGLADDLDQAVSARDLDAAGVVVSRLRVRAERAEGLTTGPLWGVAAALPGIGPNVDAVRTAAAQLLLVADDVLAPLVDLAGSVNGPVLPGSVAHSAARIQQPLADAAAALDDARAGMRRVDAGALVPPLREAVVELRSALDSGAPALDGVARIGSVLPGMLGLGQPRDILLMLQNPAELRTGGGITGTFVQLRAAEGVVSLVRQADSGLFPARSTPIGPVPEATTALYGDVAGRFVQNATMTSDFAVSAALASAWWSSQYAVVPDAVIAIDPLVLRALLAAHGPVVLGDGSQLDEGNVVRRLLVDPYLLLAPDAQTAYLQDVASSLLTALLGSVDPLAWTEALLPAVAEGRVSLWSADAAEQELLAGSPVGGPRARLDSAGDAGYAVYLNDATGGKMDSFLGVSIAVTVRTGCRGALPEAEVRVTLTHTASADRVPDLPPSMTGAGLFGTAVGDIGTNVTVAAPPGAGSGGVSDDAGALPSRDVLDDDRPFSAVRVNLSPGESEGVVFRFVLRSGAAQHPIVLHTPTIDAVPVTTQVEYCDG